MRLRLTVLALLLCLSVPAAAGAQSSPFQPLPAPPPEEQPLPERPKDLADTGMETWQQALIFGGGLILLVGIAWGIMLDARRRAPDGPQDTSTEAELRTGLSPHQKARQRQKQRAARKARKKNR